MNTNVIISNDDIGYTDCVAGCHDCGVYVTFETVYFVIKNSCYSYYFDI